jgi:hypothetical protein
MNRPLEGDIVYVPYPLDTFFQIKFVEHEDMFYELGNLKVYNLTCEKYEYNHDLVDTGNTVIDTLLEANNTYAVQLNVENGLGDYINGETIYQGTSLANAECIAEVFNWESNVITIGNITTEFTSNVIIIGNTSNAQWYYSNSANWDNDSIIIPTQYSDNWDLDSNASVYIVSSNDDLFGLGV